MAEVVLIERHERAEELQLLALIARGLGAKGLDRYETPEERIGEWLAEAATPVEARLARIEQIRRMAAAAGGEIG